jgi:hypothetical protein
VTRVTLRPVHENDLTIFEEELHTPEGRGPLQRFGYRAWGKGGTRWPKRDR